MLIHVESTSSEPAMLHQPQPATSTAACAPGHCSMHCSPLPDGQEIATHTSNPHPLVRPCAPQQYYNGSVDGVQRLRLGVLVPTLFHLRDCVSVGGGKTDTHTPTPPARRPERGIYRYRAASIPGIIRRCAVIDIVIELFLVIIAS